MSVKAKALLRHFNEFTIIKLLPRTSIRIIMIVLIPNIPAKYMSILEFYIHENVPRVYVWILCCVHCALFKLKEMSSCRKKVIALGTNAVPL
jgi:hypothetical protein